MSPKSKRTSALSKNSFSETLLRISHRFPLFSVFDDFLTMSIAACTINPETKLSWYEDEYLSAIASYKDSELRHEFPKAFASLISEMQDRITSSQGNDLLGEFFEQHISNGRNGQYFTPYPVCQLMASITKTDTALDNDQAEGKQLKILDPACGSGRMLLATHKSNSLGHEYYGIDIDRICVKIAALNLFLNGVWKSEVMCANALVPGDFVISYKISFLPLGIFKIREKEESLLWQMQQYSFTRQNENPDDGRIKKPFIEIPNVTNSTQLDLF